MNRRFNYDLPQNYYFGGGGETFATPLAICTLLLVIFLLVVVRRKHILPVFLTGVMLMPWGVNFAIAGINFPVLRVFVGVTLLRMFLKGEAKFGKFLTFDKVFVAWAFSNAIAFSVLWATMGAVVNRLGFLWNVIGAYFICRILIRDKRDIVTLMRTLAGIILLLAVPIAIEHFTRQNLFSLLGAPPLADIRNGQVRAHGPFGHPIIAGTIAAMLIPLFAGVCWLDSKRRTLFFIAIPACLVIVVSCASSTPLMTIGAGLIGFCMWALRKKMRIVRWAAVVGLIGMQMAMNAPVWFLIKRVGGSIGGSGYHRAMLIDTFVRHFSDWWLLGTRDNASWGFDMWDVDNAYVAAGLGGGLLTFLLFITLIVLLFRQTGQARIMARGTPSHERFVWAVGCCLFANVVGFFGIVYFDQSVVIWLSVLALIVATPQLAHESAIAEVPAKKKVRIYGSKWHEPKQDAVLYSSWGKIENGTQR